MSMVSLVLVPIFAGVLLYKIPRRTARVLILIVEGYLAAAAVRLFWQQHQVGMVRQLVGGEESILFIELRADAIAAAFVCLAVFLFAVTFLYTYSDSWFDNRFTLLFLVLQGLLSGVFVADDLFHIFVLLEVATVTVAILIMFKRDGRAIYDGLVYLMIQIVSMAFFLFGVGYLYKIFGVLSLDGIAQRMSGDIKASALILPSAFLFTAVCLKCGFFPLFSWLPKAHGTPSAPAAVSAILSGLFVKNGLYLFIRLNRLFYPVMDFTSFFLVIAVCTGIVGFLLALSSRDIKLILAYHTVSQVGLIAVGLCVPNQAGYWGSIYHMLNHAVFKSLLFLTSGMIIEEYKTRDIRKIRGVFKRMPVTAAASVLAILGITGAPLFNGSISKYWILYGLKGHGAELAVWIINTGTIISFVKYSTIFFGEGVKSAEGSKLKRAVILALGLICFGGGVFGTSIVNLLFGAGLSIDDGQYVLKAVLYFVTIGAGIVIYRCFIRKSKLLYRLGDIRLTFPQTCFVMVLFFVCVLLWGISQGEISRYK